MLEVKNLRKTFGEVVAVDDVSFSVEPGTILGMIGQNGSGKTTIFRMIVNFLTPENNGKVEWNGEQISNQLQDILGYLPEERGLYDKMTIEQQIIYFAELRGMKRSDVKDKIDEWLALFNVKGTKTDKVKTLSKGNQQKVQLIATLIHEPKLVILDEPFSGLDPVNADLLKQGILRLKEKGSVIIFSSHNMNNVAELCDKLVMIHHGKQVLSGTLEQVYDHFGKIRLLIEAPDWSSETLQQIEGVISAKNQSRHLYLLELENETVGQRVFDTVSKGKYLPVFYQHAPSLEEIFKLKAGETHE